MFVDSHCHLSFPELRGNIAEIRAAMQQSRVDRALCICTTMEEFEVVHRLAMSYDDFWCSVGVHPDSEGVREPLFQELLELAAKPRVVAIGETGLDYFRLGSRSHSDMEWQRERFRTHIRAALHCGLPLVVHTRNAASDTLDVLGQEGGRRATGVFHCFTEGLAVARGALDLGFYISFSGILTFKNATQVREVARFVPLDRCLIETDSPYLAPMPYRGKVNNPSYVVHVAQKLAELKQLSLDSVAESTSRNFERLFTRTGTPPQGPP
ncbi:MAG: TatD family hydrolase [Burkholderiaceae bacterium]